MALQASFVTRGYGASPKLILRGYGTSVSPPMLTPTTSAVHFITLDGMPGRRVTASSGAGRTRTSASSGGRTRTVRGGGRT